VGIGTTSPDAKLTVRGTNNNAVSNQTFWNFDFVGEEICNLSNTTNSTAGLVLLGGNGRTSVSGIANVLESTSLGSLAFFTGGSGVGGGSVPERMRITSGGTVQPGANGTQDLGTSSLRWATVFTSDLSLSNGIGDYTIVEGENDLFLYNNKQCKVYRFMLEQVCAECATPKKS
jgi:hypothetical protein